MKKVIELIEGDITKLRLTPSLTQVTVLCWAEAASMLWARYRAIPEELNG